VAAALGFILPTSAISLTAILIWGRVRQSPWPSAMRAGLAPVALGLGLASVYTMGLSVMTNVSSLVIDGVSTLIFWRTSLPTPLVILGAGALGALALAR
jgi:chromate transporter